MAERSAADKVRVTVHQDEAVVSWITILSPSMNEYDARITGGPSWGASALSSRRLKCKSLHRFSNVRMWFHSEQSQNTLSRQAAATWVTALKVCSFPASSHGVKGKRTLSTKGYGLGGSPSALAGQIIHKTLFCSVILTSQNPSSVIIYLGIKQRIFLQVHLAALFRLPHWQASTSSLGRTAPSALLPRLSPLPRVNCVRSWMCRSRACPGFPNFSGYGSKKGVWTDKWRPMFLSYSYSCLPQWYL